MAFKMKGHTLPGPYQQKKQVDKANAAAEAANAARDAARAADKEFKTFAYDYAEPGTARADSLGGEYTPENARRFNELGGIREDAAKDADKAYKAYEKAADKAKKKGATSSPAKQRKGKYKVSTNVGEPGWSADQDANIKFKNVRSGKTTGYTAPSSGTITKTKGGKTKEISDKKFKRQIGRKLNKQTY